MTIDQVKKQLQELSVGNEKYREFMIRIVNDLDGVEFVGVRTPDLRKIIKELAKGDYKEFIKNNDWSVYEMKQIAFGMPNYLKELPIDDFFEVIDMLAPHTSSWANTDALGLKLSYDKDKIWSKIESYLNSNDAWTVRIGLNFVFANMLDEDNIERTMSEIRKIDARYREKAKKGTLNYYVKMMLAWTLAEAAVSHREKVEEVLLELDSETAKYTRQKMRDSFRIK